MKNKSQQTVQKTKPPEGKKHFEFRPLGHNLVNLLYAMRGMMEAHLLCVEEGAFPENGERIRHAEDVMKKAQEYAQKALDITHRFGQRLREEEEGYGSKKTSSVRDVWESAVEHFAEEARSAGLEILCRVPEKFPEVACNEESLYEIFQSLISNALAALKETTPELRKIVLRAELGFSTQEEAAAVLTVADTGKGIADCHLNALFRPFFTTKPSGEGNGLGLCLVRELVEKNRGLILISSFKNCGTTVTIRLPLSSPAMPLK